jgi:hypothetical protein
VQNTNNIFESLIECTIYFNVGHNYTFHQPLGSKILDEIMAFQGLNLTFFANGNAGFVASLESFLQYLKANEACRTGYLRIWSACGGFARRRLS